MNAPTFVDTNILIYARDASEPDKQARAADWLARLWRTREGRVSVQVLQEYYINVTRKLDPGLPIPDARADVRALLAWKPVQTSPDIIEAAWALQDRFMISWWDALIVAAARSAGCERLLTEDLQAGQVFHDLTVVDPFGATP
jgi:predicted nucleic acid-binding protein